jgi:hypothetical protein
MEIGIILLVVLIGLVAGDVALVRALQKRRRNPPRDERDQCGPRRPPS